MRTFKIWCCYLLLVTSSSALAQVAVKKAFKLVDTPEGSLAMQFEDGREAEVLTATASYQTFPLKMQMTENMCHPEFGKPDCRLNFRLEMTQVDLLWTRHPDATKIGQKVIAVYSPEQKSPLFAATSFNQNEEDAPSLFICDDYRWMTGSESTDIPRQNLLLSWGTESNFTNGETGLNENLTFSGAFNLELSAVFGRIYQMRSRQYISYSATSLALVSAGPATLVLRKPKSQELCQVQFNTDLSLARTAIARGTELLKKAPYKKLRLIKAMKAQARGNLQSAAYALEFL